MESTNLRGVCEIFLRYTREIHRKSTPKDPNFLAISSACGKIEQFVESVFPSATTPTIAQQQLEAERAENALTPEEKKEMRTVYVAIFAFWIVMFGIMSFIAWCFGARFDHLWKDLWNMGAMFLGKSEGDGARVEL
jgi:farnesyl-diphosphate farnesyltransferase